MQRLAHNGPLFGASHRHKKKMQKYDIKNTKSFTNFQKKIYKIPKKTQNISLNESHMKSRSLEGTACFYYRNGTCLMIR